VPRTLAVVLATLAVVMGLFALTASSQVATVAWLILMGTFGFATVPGLQMRIMRYAGKAPTLASGANIAAFNVGNAAGAWLGGLVITAGLGYASTLWVGAALSLAGLLVLAGAEVLARRPSVVGGAGDEVSDAHEEVVPPSGRTPVGAAR
jgi:DHA1 family inner membrane transport protein